MSLGRDDVCELDSTYSCSSWGAVRHVLFAIIHVHWNAVDHRELEREAEAEKAKEGVVK